MQERRDYDIKSSCSTSSSINTLFKSSPRGTSQPRRTRKFTNSTFRALDLPCRAAVYLLKFLVWSPTRMGLNCSGIVVRTLPFPSYLCCHLSGVTPSDTFKALIVLHDQVLASCRRVGPNRFNNVGICLHV